VKTASLDLFCKWWIWGRSGWWGDSPVSVLLAAFQPCSLWCHLCPCDFFSCWRVKLGTWILLAHLKEKKIIFKVSLKL